MLRHSKPGVDVNTANINSITIDDRYPLLRILTILEGTTQLPEVNMHTDTRDITVDLPTTFDYPFVKPYVSINSTVNYWDKLYTLPYEFIIEESPVSILKISYDYKYSRTIRINFYRENINGDLHLPAVDVRYKIPILIVKEKQ